MRSQREQQARARLAYHEAGHVIVCAAVGGRVLRAMIGDNGGAVDFEPPDDRIDHIAVLLAGDQAAALACIAPVKADPGKPDYQRVRQLLDHLSRGEQAVAMAAAEQRAATLLWSRWAAVVRVADALLRADVLSGRDVARLLG